MGSEQNPLKESGESDESGERFFKRFSKGCAEVVGSEQNALGKRRGGRSNPFHVETLHATSLHGMD